MASTGKSQYLVWPLLALSASWTVLGRLSWLFLFSEVIFWYIIPGFFQHRPELFLRFKLSFISFSVQGIPYCLYNIHVWTLRRRVHDCQCFTSCFSLRCSVKYDLTTWAVSLGSLSCWKIKPFPSRLFPEGMAWWIKTCLYFSAFMISSIWIHDLINIANTTGRNAGPNQDRPSTVFHWRPQALIPPSLSNSSSHILSAIGHKNVSRSLKEETLRNFSSDFESFLGLSVLLFVLDLSRFFKYLYNSLNTTSWVFRFWSEFAYFPLRVVLVMQN